jgi:hypothetical protein
VSATLPASVVFLCTNNEIAKKCITKEIPLTLAIKQSKYLRMNLIKEMKPVNIK